MSNKFILVGIISSIKKVKGIVQSFHIDVIRDDTGVIDSPIIIVPENLSSLALSYSKVRMIVEVEGRIETVVKGGYGTVTTLMAHKITCAAA